MADHKCRTSISGKWCNWYPSISYKEEKSNQFKCQTIIIANDLRTVVACKLSGRHWKRLRTAANYMKANKWSWIYFFLYRLPHVFIRLPLHNIWQLIRLTYNDQQLKQFASTVRTVHREICNQNLKSSVSIRLFSSKLTICCCAHVVMRVQLLIS